MENKYIKTYDNVLTKDQCQHIIDKFEDSKQHWQKNEFRDQGKSIDGKGWNFHRSFTEINLNLHDDWSEYIKILYNTMGPYIKKYAESYNITSTWPRKFGWEHIRMKKYEANNKDEFKDHVDVMDYASAKRFLVFFLYLNDNEGGLTSFSDYGINVKPEAGKMLMFPPLWTHKHAGTMPIKEPKYIIGSYLHYV